MTSIPNADSLIVRDVQDYLQFQRNDAHLRELEPPAGAVVIVRHDEAVILPGGQAASRVGWQVVVDGHVHGGRHYGYLNAVEHAARCSQWSLEQHADWRARRFVA